MLNNIFNQKMSGTVAHSGCPGPKLVPYGKNGVKFTTMVYSAETLDKLPEVRLSSEDIVVATYPKAGKGGNAR